VQFWAFWSARLHWSLTRLVEIQTWSVCRHLHRGIVAIKEWASLKVQVVVWVKEKFAVYLVQGRAFLDRNGPKILQHWPKHGDIWLQLVTRQQIHFNCWKQLQKRDANVGRRLSAIRKDPFNTRRSRYQQIPLATVPHKLDWDKYQLANHDCPKARPVATRTSNSRKTAPRCCWFRNWCKQSHLLAPATLLIICTTAKTACPPWRQNDPLTI